MFCEHLFIFILILFIKEYHKLTEKLAIIK